MERTDKVRGVGIFFVSFVFYYFTLAPTVLWGDGAKLALYTYNLYLPFDIIGGHPLHTLIGKLFSYIPIGDFAFRQNVMSSFFGSTSLMLLFFTMRNFGVGRFASILGAFTLGVSHTFWLISVINETYSLAVFFIASMLWIVSKWISKKENSLLLYLFSFLFGLSFSNNLLPVFLLPAILYFFILRKNREFIARSIMPMALFFIAGNFLLILLFFKEVGNSGEGIINFVSRFIYGRLVEIRSPNVIAHGNPLSESMKYFGYLVYQFPFLAFFIGIFGMRALFSLNKKLFCMTLIIVISFLAFGSNYLLQRKFYLLSPTYLVFAIYLGFGLDGLFKYLKGSYWQLVLFKMLAASLLILIPLLTYWFTPQILYKIDAKPIKVRTLPYRDNLRFYFWPAKRNEYGARRYGEEALRVMEPGSVILADFTPGKVLEYLQVVEGVRQDVKIEIIDQYLWILKDRSKEMISKLVDENIKSGAVYLADNEPYYEIEHLKQKYNITKDGVIYRINKRK